MRGVWHSRSSAVPNRRDGGSHGDQRAGTVVHPTDGTTTIEDLKTTNGVADVISAEGNGCCVGGGIAISGATAAAEVVGSLVTGNSATFFGGGIDVDAGTLTLVDSTVSGNKAWSAAGRLRRPSGQPGRWNLDPRQRHGYDRDRGPERVRVEEQAGSVLADGDDRQHHPRGVA
jgi:hypothetical protein